MSRVSNRGCREADGVVCCRWHSEVRKGDTDVADGGAPLRSLDDRRDLYGCERARGRSAIL